MPVARFEMPDGRVAKFDVPKDAPIDQISRFVQEQMRMSPPEQQEAAIPGPVGAGNGGPPGVRVDESRPPAPTPPRDQAIQPVEPVGVATGMPSVDALLQGISLGTYDELQAGTGAAVDKLRGVLTGQPVDFMDRYREYHKGLTEERETFREKAPITSLVSEVGGGMLSGGGLIGMGRQLGGGIPLMMAEGAGVGALAGAATAEPGERLPGMAGGAALGGALGAAVPAVTGAVGRAVGRVKKGAGMKAAEEYAKKTVRKELGVTPQEAAIKMREMGPEATLADVGGKDIEALAYKVANTPGPASDIMENFLEERTKGEYSRIMGRAKELLGTKKSYFDALDELKVERKAVADPLYEQARSQPLQMTDKLREVLKLPTMRKAVKGAVEKAADDGVKLADGELDIRTLDYAKRVLDDKIGAAIRRGKSDRVGQLQKIKGRLLTELDGQNEAYAKARAAWSGSKELENAIELGAQFGRGESDIVAREVAALTPTERDGFRIGAMRGLKHMIARTADTNSIARKFQNPAMRERLSVIFPRPEAFDDFMRSVMSEARYAEVRNRVLRGSQTAPRMRREGVGEDVRGAVTEGIVTGGLPFANIIRGAARRVGVGPSPAQAEQIARMLTTPGRQLGGMVPQVPGAQSLAEILMRRSGGAMGGAGGMLAGR